MQDEIKRKYLETEVQTATPQKLHKMLLDGAVRFALTAKQAAHDGKDPETQAAFDRCRDIVSELLAGIRGKDELSEKVTGLYSFVLRSLIDIQQNYDEAKLIDVVEILEIERETWRLLCEKMPEAPERDDAERGQSAEITAQQATNILDTANADQSATFSQSTPPTDAGSMGGFSIDA